MKRIYKYTLEDQHWYGKSGSPIQMPKGARILSAQEQHGEIQLWAIVDLLQDDVPRWFRVCGTGHDLPENPGEFVATVQLGEFVWHVFEVTK
jgi:hypothetical protein